MSETQDDDLMRLLARVGKLGPNADAKLVGALSVLAPTVLSMALDRLEEHERIKSDLAGLARREAGS